MADEVVVMYAGAVMERAPRRDAVLPQPPPLHRGPARLAARRRAAGRAGSPRSRARRPVADRAARPAARSPRAAATRSTGAGQRTPPLDTVHDDPLHRSACWLPDDARARTAIRDRLRAEPLRRGEPAMSDAEAARCDARGTSTEVLWPGVQEFPAGAPGWRRHARGGAGRRRGDAGGPPRRDPRAGRRDRLRQVDPGPLPGPAVRPDLGVGVVRRPRHHARCRAARCARCGATSR